MSFHIDKDTIYAWLMALMALYIVVEIMINLYRRRSLIVDNVPSRVFDASSFAASIMLAIGIVRPEVLAAIGDTKPFLVVGAVVGVWYSINALLARARA